MNVITCPCPSLDTGLCHPGYMMTSSNGNIFRVTGPLRGEFTGDRWIPRTKASIPRTKASNAELSWFLGSSDRFIFIMVIFVYILVKQHLYTHTHTPWSHPYPQNQVYVCIFRKNRLYKAYVRKHKVFSKKSFAFIGIEITLSRYEYNHHQGPLH